MSNPVDRVRILWADHLGLARGKYVPASLAASGARHCTGTWALGYDRDMTPYTPGSHWEEGLPDFEATFDESDLRPGWEANTQVVVANLRRHGAAFEVSPKAALEQAVEAWREIGYEPFVGIELEAYLMEPDGAGGWKPLHAPGAYVYGTGPAVDPTGTIDEIWRVATDCGMPIESVNSEYDPAQFEFTLRYTNAVRAADDAFLFKLMAKEIAAKRGYLLTFMGKPLSNNGGSGLHFNMSFKDAKGNNVINDTCAEDGVSTFAKHAIGGMLAHHQALAGICAPTVNAYKRLRPASLSGFWANWGYDHRGATIRIPSERGSAARLEHRLSDGAAVIYTAMAAVLHAARFGVIDQLDPGVHEGGTGLDTIDAKVGVPPSLSQALDALEADTRLVEALGATIVAQHVAVKRSEWERYCNATTDWEINEYLNFL